MAATLPIQRIVNVTHYSHHHGNLAIEAPNQTFKQGNLLRLNATGQAEATPAGAAAATSKNFLAARNARNVAAPTESLPRVTPYTQMIFEVTAGGAAATDALIQPGKKYGYAIDQGTGFGYLNLADAGTAVFEIVAHNGSTMPRSHGGTIGDTNVRVYARLLAQ